jgi:hypothetical protein
MSELLPAGFSSLVRFGDWIVADESDRVEKRLNATMPEAQELYDAMTVELEHIMGYLKTRPANEPSLEDQNLVHLVFALIEVAQSVEIYGQGAVVDGADLREFVPVVDRPLAEASHG